jgi:hypothetical protein
MPDGTERKSLNTSPVAPLLGVEISALQFLRGSQRAALHWRHGCSQKIYQRYYPRHSTGREQSPSCTASAEQDYA